MVRRLIKSLLSGVGYELRPIAATAAESDLHPDISPDEWKIIDAARPYTMTSTERLIANIRAIEYVVKYGVRGDVVECGVWRGGCTISMALALKLRGDAGRNLWLYDTFDGMTDPTTVDEMHSGASAKELLALAKQNEVKESSLVLAYASLEDVKRNLATTGYTQSLMHFVKGPVEQTIPAILPPSIALLRLDTDWYESTRHELTHLFPLLVPGGILIVDDYGWWKGCRKAVDEYFAGQRVFLHRIDNTGRLLVCSQSRSES